MNNKLKISFLFIFGFILLTSNVYAETTTQWVSVGKEESFSTKSTNYMSIKLDSNDIPYVSYFDSVDKKIYVRKFNGTEWEILGGKELYNGDINTISFALDKNNTPYLTYGDSENDTISVLKYKNGVWEKVNLDGLSKEKSGLPFISFDKNNILSISYLYADKDGNSWTGVSKFNGSKWENVSSNPINMMLACLSMSFDNNNKPYLSCFTKIGKKSVVIRFNGTEWEKVGDISGVFNEEKNNIVFDKNNNPYFSYLDGEYRNNLHVIKFNGTEWKEVGKMNFVGDDIWNSILAIDKNDVLYVAYPNVFNVMQVSIIRFNGTEWKKLEYVGANSGLVSFAIDNKNIPYIVYYKDYTNLGKNEETVTIKKFVDRAVSSQISNNSILNKTEIKKTNDSAEINPIVEQQKGIIDESMSNGEKNNVVGVLNNQESFLELKWYQKFFKWFLSLFN